MAEETHHGLNKHTLVARFMPNWVIRAGRIEMFRPQALPIKRYNYRGTKIPTPWTARTGPSAPAA